MSLLPIESIRAMQKNIDMCIEIWGLPCEMFIIKDADARETLSVSQEISQDIYNPPFETKIWIVWNPEMKWLRNMGIFVDAEAIPTVAFGRSDNNISRNSYFKLNLSYGVGKDQAEEFEFVDHLAQKMYTEPVVTAWKIAPRRK